MDSNHIDLFDALKGMVILGAVAIHSGAGDLSGVLGGLGVQG